MGGGGGTRRTVLSHLRKGLENELRLPGEEGVREFLNVLIRSCSGKDPRI